MKILDTVGDVLETYVDEKNFDSVFIEMDAAGKITAKVRNDLIRTIIKYLHAKENTLGSTPTLTDNEGV